MKVICNIPFKVEGMNGYSSNGYFDENRTDRFLAIGIADIIYNSAFSIEAYHYVINVIGKDKVIDLVREEYKKINKSFTNSMSVLLDLDLSEDELLYHKLKLNDDFDDFFVLGIDC